MNVNMRTFLSIVAVGILSYSCSDLPNSLTQTEKDSLDLVNTEFNNLTSEPIQINNYDVVFNGKTYNESSNQSIFSYTVSGTGVEPALNSLFIEVPSCAGNPLAFSPIQSAKIRQNGIEWESSIPASSSANYSITYSGDLPIGFVNATIESGNSSATQEIPGPCKGIYTISGNIYIDANSNQSKESSESGIQNVTLQLIADNEVVDTQKTLGLGAYTFTVFTGNKTTDFTVKIVDETADPSDFNEQLFSTHASTSTSPMAIVTVNGADVSAIDFGFAPQTQKLIQEFGDGTIQLRTEQPKFWIKQLRFAKTNNKKAEVPADELLGYLNQIEGLLLADPFQFGANKIENALDILTKPIKTDLEALLVQLLTAELNVLSSRGSDSIDFDLALLAFGESAANDGAAATGPNNEILQKSISPDASAALASSNLINDAKNLLSSYNFSGSGGGVGNN